MGVTVKERKVISEATASSPARVIRDPGFAHRFNQACDAHRECPALHHGRLAWVRDEFENRFKEKVSIETVRKWSIGETKPYAGRMELLAQLLEVPVEWLHLGAEHGVSARERKARNAMASGAANLIAGLIQLDGGHPAFPEQDGPVDLHAIIKGAKYDFHVSLGDDDGRFLVPVDHEGVIVLGVVRHGFSFEIYEIPVEVIDQYGERKGRALEVTVDLSTLNRIEGFDRRI